MLAEQARASDGADQVATVEDDPEEAEHPDELGQRELEPFSAGPRLARWRRLEVTTEAVLVEQTTKPSRTGRSDRGRWEEAEVQPIQAEPDAAAM